LDTNFENTGFLPASPKTAVKYRPSRWNTGHLATLPGTAVGYVVGRRTIVVLCHAYIYSSKHIFGLCIILSCISSKGTQTYFDTYFPCISTCWARTRGLQKIVSFNPAQATSKHKHFCCPCPKWADFVYSLILD